MVGDSGKDVVLREWRFLWWYHAIVEGGDGRAVLVGRRTSGAEVSIRFTWRRWIMMMRGQTAVTVFVALICWLGTAEIMSIGTDREAYTIISLFWLVFAFFVIRTAIPVYHTLRVPKSSSWDSISHYR